MKKEEGLTLVEIIISIALLGVLAIVFLTIFNFGNQNIISAGDRTEDVLEGQNEINLEIKNPSNLGEEDEIIIKIPDQEIQPIKGYFVTEEKNKIKITTFIPKDIFNE